jgi:hypothetical protein
MLISGMSSSLFRLLPFSSVLSQGMLVAGLLVLVPANTDIRSAGGGAGVSAGRNPALLLLISATTSPNDLYPSSSKSTQDQTSALSQTQFRASRPAPDPCPTTHLAAPSSTVHSLSALALPKFLQARTDCVIRFTGPKVNIEHAMLGREGNVLDGKADDGSSSGSQSGAAGMEEDSKIKKTLDV